jgi:hypothetical protein
MLKFRGFRPPTTVVLEAARWAVRGMEVVAVEEEEVVAARWAGRWAEVDMEAVAGAAAD